MKKYINTISSFQFFQLLRYTTFVLIGIVFTKTSLGQYEIGRYETFLFLSGALSFFWLNGLLKALLPLSANNNKGSSVFSAFVVIQFFSIVAVVFLLLLHPFISDNFLKGKEIPEIHLLLLFLVFSVPASLVEYMYLIKKKNRILIWFGLIFFFMQFLMVALPSVMGFGIEKSILGLLFSSMAKYIWLWICFFYYGEIKISVEFIKQHLKLGAPLVAATFLSGSAQYVDGFIVTSNFDEATFAVFRYGARELPLVMILANALSNAMLPRFANKNDFSKNIQSLKTSTSRLMHFLFPASILFLLISYPVFPVIFNADFAESAAVFNIYLLLITSRLLFPQTILNGMKLGRPILLASFFELILNVSLSLVFVQLWGLAGIAFATVFAYVFEKIILVLHVKKKLKISFSEYTPVKIYFIYSTLVIIVFIFAELVIKDYGFFIG